MIDVRKLKDEFDETAAALARRGVEKATLEKARDLDAKRRALLAETETLKAKRNAASKEIGKIAKEGGDIAAAKDEMRKVGDRIAEIDRELAEAGAELRETLLMIPNIPAPEIPTGMDSSANVVVRKVGEWKDPSFKILDHMAVGEKLAALRVKPFGLFQNFPFDSTPCEFRGSRVEVVPQFLYVDHVPSLSKNQSCVLYQKRSLSDNQRVFLWYNMRKWHQ